MKAVCPFLAAGLLLAGCATSTIESRRTERLAAYDSLSAEAKALVDKGRIKVGMNEDAVYIAWGAPLQITHGENKEGETTVWLYSGMWLQDRSYWNSRVVYGPHHAHVETYLDHYYYPREFYSGEVTFSKGEVVDWKTLPRPYY